MCSCSCAGKDIRKQVLAVQLRLARWVLLKADVLAWTPGPGNSLMIRCLLYSASFCPFEINMTTQGNRDMANQRHTTQEPTLILCTCDGDLDLVLDDSANQREATAEHYEHSIGAGICHETSR
jgi:hypothetical protein